MDLRGELRFDAPSGRSVQLRADGRSLVLDVPGWPELRALAPRTLSSRRKAIVASARQLVPLGIALNVNLRGRRLCSFGAGVRPTLLSRALGLGPVNLRLSALVCAG